MIRQNNNTQIILESGDLFDKVDEYLNYAKSFSTRSWASCAGLFHPCENIIERCPGGITEYIAEVIYLQEIISFLL